MGNQHVLPFEGKWAIRAEGDQHPSRVVATQFEAIKAARSLASDHGDLIVVHDVAGGIVTAEPALERPIPRWLAIAREASAQTPDTPLHLRPRRADASVERVREL